MKLLVVLSALQTAAIVFLAFKVMDKPDAPSAGTRFDPLVQEERLREIVRAELAASRVLAERATTDAPVADAAPARSVAPPAPIDQQAQLDRVTQQLEHYKSQGYMSPADMQDYHEQIGRLDPAARQEMLRNLVKAMNAGEIKGQL